MNLSLYSGHLDCGPVVDTCSLFMLANGEQCLIRVLWKLEAALLGVQLQVGVWWW